MRYDDRFGPEVVEIELKLRGAISGVERRAGASAGYTQETDRHFGSVGQDHRHSVAGFHASSAQGGDRLVQLRPEALVSYRKTARTEKRRRIRGLSGMPLHKPGQTDGHVCLIT